MFWYRWPSWLVELGSGLIVATIVQVPHVHNRVRVAGAIALSVVYEARIDRNGWSWRDVGQRSIGIGVGLTIWWRLRS